MKGIADMFKTNEDSEKSPTRFGVGSIIKGSYQKWVVLGAEDSKGKRICVVDLDTFQLVGWADGVVSDFNFMTEKEARNIVNSTVGRELQWTFTDFELDAKGLK